MQFIIITHDAEIFEDSTVEQIYKFESSEHGSKVTLLKLRHTAKGLVL